MPITVLKNNVPWGPFTRVQIQDGLSRGDFTLQYLAHGPGLKEWLPLGEVLDHFDRGTNLPPVPGARSIVSMPGALLPEVPVESEMAAPVPPPPKTSVPPPMPMPMTSPVAPITTLPPSSAPAPATTKALTPAKPAGFFPRFIAFAIDCGVLFLPVLFLFGLGMLTIEIQGAIEHTNAESMHQERLLLQQNFKEVLGLVALGGAWLYAAVLECSRWQATVGKQWMRMKVVDEHGERLSFFRATGRHAAKFLSALPLFLGFTMALFSSSRLALHDRIAATRVVKK